MTCDQCWTVSSLTGALSLTSFSEDIYFKRDQDTLNIAYMDMLGDIQNIYERCSFVFVCFYTLNRCRYNNIPFLDKLSEFHFLKMKTTNDLPVILSLWS